MDLSKGTIDLLENDLQLSSSDDEMEESVSTNEAGHPSASAARPNKEGNSVRIEEGPTRDAVDLEEGEIEFPDIPNCVSTINTSGRRPEFTDRNLDVCRERNIHPPPRGHLQQNQHRFQHDERQLVGARSGSLNVNPRRNVSLGETIFSPGPSVGPSRQQTIRRRQHSLGDARNTGPAQQQRKEKLKRGVNTITGFHPESGNPIFGSAKQTPERHPEFQEEPWQCVQKLISKGFSIFMRSMKLKNDKNLSEEEESRLYKCVLTYKNIQGICEASNGIQAKHGASVDLLVKLRKQFPDLGRFPEKVNEALLIKKCAWNNFMREMKDTHGNMLKYRFTTSSSKVNKHTLFKCVLSIAGYQYEGYSYLTERAAKSLAIKKAYDYLMEEECPLDTIHLGVEQCTTDESLYRETESQMFHYFEFPESVFNEQSTAQVNEVTPAQVTTTARHPPLRRDEYVPVCYLMPQ